MSLVALVAFLVLYLFIDPVSEAAWRALRWLRLVRAVPANLFDGLLEELDRVAPLGAGQQTVAFRVRTQAEPRLTR